MDSPDAYGTRPSIVTKEEMMETGTAVVRAGEAARMSLGRLERQLLLSGMLSSTRSSALNVARVALVIALDFLPATPDGDASAGDTTVARKLEDMLR